MSARQAVTQRLRRSLEHWPRVYMAFVQRRNTSFTPLRPNTALVISGFGSSGNSYLRAATLAANPGIEIASHAHNWTEVALAVRRGLPTVFVAREPLQSVASVLARYAPVATAPYVLEEYARLYERSRPRRASVLVADFAEATGDVGGVIRRVNARFGTSFVPFRDDDDAAVQTVSATMRGLDADALGERAALTGSSPSVERDGRKAVVIEELNRPEYAALLARCRAAYDAMTSI
jgi:hypothetical protein